MTSDEPPDDGEDVVTLQQLIRARMDERGWSYGDLERLAKGQLTKGRWQQLGSGTRMTSFPEPATLTLIAETIEVDIAAVVLATARTVGLPARGRGPDIAQLLPAGTDRLSERMRDALLGVIRAAVADTLTRGDNDNGDRPVNTWDTTLEWPKDNSRLRDTSGPRQDAGAE